MTYLEQLEALSYIVTVVGLPLGIYVYLRDQQKERKNEEEEVYVRLSDQYADFLELVLKNADLQLTTRSAPLAQLTAEQQERRMVLFEILIALFERASSRCGTALTGLLGMVIALAIVLGLAFVTLRTLKRWQDRGFERGGDADRQLRFVRALPIGQRERLLLVEAQGELMLIGVSAGSVSLLRNWGSDAAPLADDAPVLP